MLSGDFARTQYGGGTVTHDTTFNGLLLTTPSGTSTEVGNNREKKAQYTSNTYHHYFPGSSHLIMMTAAVGDTGQAGVVREWGYYDDDNGYYFRVNEEQTSELAITLNLLFVQVLMEIFVKSVLLVITQKTIYGILVPVLGQKQPQVQMVGTVIPGMGLVIAPQQSV